ncbi:Bacterial regulatory protein, MarR [mine drainage metagenome]|uniref:Bacterial regulatory protein, MarR n=1 Tax=mine drainage metagenome TaxID=410659 RepID=T0ZRX0_9ZZZZ
MEAALNDEQIRLLDADLEEFRRRLRVRVRRAMRDAAPEGVGSPAFHIVEALAARGPLSPSDLAALLEVRTSTMAAHLDRLEDLGWVRREAAGGKRVRAAATPSGEAALARYVCARVDVLRDALRPLDAAQLQQLAQALRACVGEGLASGGTPAG